MNADTPRALVADYFGSRAASLGLDSDTLVVEYVLNWGGFVNFSYRIRDARQAYHLKLSPEADGQAALRRWRTLAPQLERYHAPPILDWIDLGPTAGLLFPALPGRPPELTDAVVGALLPVLRRLHDDRDLAAALPPAHAITARDAYLASFHDRFTEDLRGIREAPPPFISAELLQWIADQVADLARQVDAAAAFAEPLTSPVHGDLWLDNILWVGPADWYLVDWDELHIGDPVADLAALLGPSAADPRPLKLVGHLDGLLAPAERERLSLLGRATVLDWVIDPLSDWIDAGTAPEHEGTLRAEKERVHRSALACFREVFG